MFDGSNLGFYKHNKEAEEFDNDVFRCRNCDTNLTANTLANQYQRVKRIYNTVGVPSSIYTMNLGALNVYEVPNTQYEIVNVAGTDYQVSPGVNWNQMSDRRRPHIQVAVSGLGTNPGGNSTKRTITRCRPGALSPGGSGVDIKHNSYDRYLNRIKGKAPLRRNGILPDFGAKELEFNRAFPIYGGKTFKPNIVANCNCPITIDNNIDNGIFMGDTINQNININNANNANNANKLFVQNIKTNHIFHEQDEVLLHNKSDNSYSRGSIYYISYYEGTCIIALEDGYVKSAYISDIKLI